MVVIFKYFMLAKLFLVIYCVKCTYGQRDNPYYTNFYEAQQEDLNTKIQSALGKLKNAPELVKDWPNSNMKLGQVSGVAIDNSGNLVAFHRAKNVWDASTFNHRNVYQRIGDNPISTPTILVFNKTGDIVDQWGENLFYMPHGITIDAQGNTWVTDVAMHQVFKFTPNQRDRPALVLGEKFVPGDDNNHFCKPSAVAVMSNGDFFVSDGYCNTRIIKYSADGTRLLEWGKRSFDNSPYAFNVPHALALAEDRGLVCVADRERGRVGCFRTDNGTYETGFQSWLMGGRLFSVAYSPVNEGRLYIVNGPLSRVPVRGYVINFTSGRLIQSFGPDSDFHNPHDVAVSPDGATVYVAEIDPYRVCKFVDSALVNETITTERPAPTKPAAVVEWVGAGPAWGWGGAARGGAAGAGAALLLAAAAAALLRARNRGRKGGTRRRWEYGHGEFKLRRLLERRRFTRVHSDDSEDEPAPMLPPQPPANA